MAVKPATQTPPTTAYKIAMVIGVALQPRIIAKIVILIRLMIACRIVMVTGMELPIRIIAAIAWEEIQEQCLVPRTARETGVE